MKLRLENTMWLFGLVVILVGCSSEIEPSLLIRQLSVKEGTDLIADGRKVEIIAVINEDAGKDFRKVLFQTSVGNFEGGENGQVEVEAIKENDSITAKAVLIAPLLPSDVTIAAEIVIFDKKGEYVVEEVLRFSESIPHQLTLEAENLFIRNDFESQVNFTANLINSDKGSVNFGTLVLIRDIKTSDTLSAAGVYKDSLIATGALSQVSGVYATGDVPVGEVIWLIASTVEPDGLPSTTVADTVALQVVD